jgi:hypothetical protein
MPATTATNNKAIWLGPYVALSSYITTLRYSRPTNTTIGNKAIKKCGSLFLEVVVIGTYVLCSQK